MAKRLASLESQNCTPLSVPETWSRNRSRGSKPFIVGLMWSMCLHGAKWFIWRQTNKQTYFYREKLMEPVWKVKLLGNLQRDLGNWLKPKLFAGTVGFWLRFSGILQGSTGLLRGWQIIAQLPYCQDRGLMACHCRTAHQVVYLWTRDLRASRFRNWDNTCFETLLICFDMHWKYFDFNELPNPDPKKCSIGVFWTALLQPKFNDPEGKKERFLHK